MRGKWAIFMLICLCISILPDITSAETDQEITLVNRDFIPDILGFFTADVDGDGVEECIQRLANHRGFMVRPFAHQKFTGPALYQANIPYYVFNVNPLDIDTLPGEELVLALKDEAGDSTWLEIRRGTNDQTILCTTEAVVGENITNRDDRRNPRWDGYLGEGYCSDLDNDGRMEIIAPLTVSYDLYPRGIYVYDYPTGKLKWSFLLAGNPDLLTIADADNDGLKEIYFKTIATSNGALVRDRMDTTAYVYALNHLGEVIWDACTRDHFDMPTGNVMVTDDNNDDTLEVYYSVLFRSESYDRHIRILERHRATDNLYYGQHSFDAREDFKNMACADFDGDGDKEILIERFPCLLDPKTMQITKRGPLTGYSLDAIGNIDGDENHRPEIIMHLLDTMCILDGDLNVISRYTMGKYGTIAGINFGIDPFGERYISILTKIGIEENQYSALTVLGFAPKTLAGSISDIFTRSTMGWSLVIIAFLIGIPLGVLVSRLGRKRREENHHNTVKYDALLADLMTFSHGQTAGKNLNRLAFLFANLPDNPGKLEEIKPNIKAAVEAYHAFTAPQLNAIISQAKSIQKLLPAMIDMERSSLALKRTFTKIPPAELSIDDAGKCKTDIPRWVADIKRGVNAIKAFITPFFSIDLTRCVPEILAGVRAYLAQENVQFNRILVNGDTSLKVFFPEADFITLFEEIIMNACTAMADADTKRLTLDIELKADEITVALSDTGTGIPIDNTTQLFDREYSTKGEGGGYGLFNAKERIERFGGRIHFRNNTPGPGATVTLIFKAVCTNA